jgi:hypothetical protein
MSDDCTPFALRDLPPDDVARVIAIVESDYPAAVRPHHVDAELALWREQPNPHCARRLATALAMAGRPGLAREVLDILPPEDTP